MTRTGLTLRLGWLGTGRMGSALALRLLAAGCDLTVYNRTKAKAEPLAARGAVIAETAADLGTADIVFVTVGSSDDLIEAILGPHGLIEGPSAPAIVVDCSTVSTEASEQIRERLAACGTALLAAPVMGNAKVALAGRLTLAVSGPEETFQQARPYLDLLGAGATYVGEGETARIVKLCHNLLLGVVIQSLAEVTILAQQYGVSLARAAGVPQQQRDGLHVLPVQDACPGEPGLPPDFYRVPAAQGLRSRPGRGPGTGGPAAGGRPGAPARAEPGGPGLRR